LLKPRQELLKSWVSRLHGIEGTKHLLDAICAAIGDAAKDVPEK